MVRRYNNRRTKYTTRRRRGYKKDTLKKVRKTIKKIQKKTETKSVIKVEQVQPDVTPLYLDGWQPDASDANVSPFGYVGAEYVARGISIKWHLTKGSGNTTGCIRLVGVWLKTPLVDGSVTEDFDSYFNTVDDYTTAISPFMAPLKRNISKSVKILFDKKISLGTFLSANYAGGPQNKHGSFYVPLNNMKTKFDRTTGNINQGRLLMWVMDRYAGTLNTFDFVGTFYYQDP